ncbi:hypothetical protein OsJ_24159 [Oryza sativa Japonica Group]|uniref:Bowman-Birk serine protease inhibitors family domain-containing protein n=1 Tax=Oryza sativa subsp. japonica TaxID=39947 RepID=A3BJI1_ORYSJ|nr:hypothetical protein OsJ_24159 [Oryza sativa Japonica Group]
MPTKKRPWECCNDVEEASSPSGLLICSDVYWGADPGPFCTPRPWEDCCDNAICNRSLPPICQCGDEVDRGSVSSRRVELYGWMTRDLDEHGATFLEGSETSQSRCRSSSIAGAHRRAKAQGVPLSCFCKKLL